MYSVVNMSVYIDEWRLLLVVVAAVAYREGGIVS